MEIANKEAEEKNEGQDAEQGGKAKCGRRDHVPVLAVYYRTACSIVFASGKKSCVNQFVTVVTAFNF